MSNTRALYRMEPMPATETVTVTRRELEAIVRRVWPATYLVGATVTQDAWALELKSRGVVTHHRIDANGRPPVTTRVRIAKRTSRRTGSAIPPTPARCGRLAKATTGSSVC